MPKKKLSKGKGNLSRNASDVASKSDISPDGAYIPQDVTTPDCHPANETTTETSGQPQAEPTQEDFARRLDGEVTLAGALEEVEALKHLLAAKDEELAQLRAKLSHQQGSPGQSISGSSSSNTLQPAEFTARWEALRAKQAEAAVKQQTFADALAVLKSCVTEIAELATSTNTDASPVMLGAAAVAQES